MMFTFHSIATALNIDTTESKMNQQSAGRRAREMQKKKRKMNNKTEAERAELNWLKILAFAFVRIHFEFWRGAGDLWLSLLVINTNWKIVASLLLLLLFFPCPIQTGIPKCLLVAKNVCRQVSN